MKRILLIPAFVLAPFIAYCQMKFISTNGDNVKMKHVSNKVEQRVKLFLSAEEVPKDAERIGILVSSFKKREKAFLTAKNFAARAGGNAILFQDGKDLSAGSQVANALLGTNIKGQYYFIVYDLKDYSLYKD
jgi:hypothetical protein